MQIHELNNFTGTLGSGAYLAVDDGNDTGKLSTQQLLAATEARIDNIIAGPAPSAEEIVDARLGDDGVTYPSLGDAIRDQVGDLKSALNLSPTVKPLLSKFTGRVVIASGAIISYSGYDVGVIKLEKGKTYRIISDTSDMSSNIIGLSNTLYSGSGSFTNTIRISSATQYIDYYNTNYDYLYFNVSCTRSGDPHYTQYAYELPADAETSSNLFSLQESSLAVQSDGNKRPVSYKANITFDENGDEMQSTTSCLTDYIPVREGDVVSSFEANWAGRINGCVFYDKNKQKIGTIVLYQPEIFGHVVPQSACYMRVSIIQQYYDDVIIRVNPTTLATKSATDLRIILDRIGNGEENKHYTVFLKNGNYDIASTFTADEINNAEYSANGWCGLVVGNNVHLKGESRDGVVLSCNVPTTYTTANRDAISTLNIKGNCVLENLTITSENIRYPIHDDFATSENTVHHLKNCKFIAGVNATGNKTNGYGLGTRSGETVIFDDCIISPYMIYHNNTGFSKPSNVVMNNCEVTERIDLWDFNCPVPCYLHLNNVKSNSLIHTFNGSHAQTINIEGVGQHPDFIECNASVKYCLGNCIKKSVHWGGSAGQLVANYYGNNIPKYNAVAVWNAVPNIIGVLLDDTANDAEGIIQTSGYISANKLGTTDYSSWAIGDYLTIGNTSHKFEKTLDVSKALAVVSVIIDSVPYVRLLLK